MKKVEWIREAISVWPTPEYIRAKENAGWRLVATEWEREVETQPAGQPSSSGLPEEIPYGTRIGGDCLHLEDNPTEMEILNLLAEMVVQDVSYKRMADTLNERAFRTRDGKPWTALAVFKLTPRLIEVAPRILSGVEWENRKKQLSRITWNS
jgi:Recombinase